MESLRVHYFKENISLSELSEQFTFPFSYTPDILSQKAASIVREYLDSETKLSTEVKSGKMFGVMIVLDKNNVPGFIAAYSGLLDNRNDIEFFVPPVFDLLKPNGFFKVEEHYISSINQEINSLENNEGYLKMKSLLEKRKEQQSKDIEDYKLFMESSKEKRNQIRSNNPDQDKIDLLIKESQYQKAELKRIQKEWNEIIENLLFMISDFDEMINNLKNERKQRSAALQKKLFDNFVMLNANGEKKNLNDIFLNTALKTPPSGAGECCAPKLLQYAYITGLKPISMAEFWMGESPKNIIRKEGYYYPACTGKCGPILEFMLEGLDVEQNPLKKDSGHDELEIVYSDNYLVIINKPAGLLSVPGKVLEKSALEILKKQIAGDYKELLAVHRLDMATSGLLMFAKDSETYKILQKMFLELKIEKHYIAILDASIEEDEGTIELPLISDYIERPKQKVDYEYGKKAVTAFSVLDRENNKTRVHFKPLTGRTHQLRVHSSHPSGLNAPIIGDELYGKKDKRLYLHSYKLKFIHPITNNCLEIIKDPEF